MRGLQTKPRHTPVWAMLATPFDARGDLDLPSLRRYLDVVAERGCDAVVLHGVVGEPSATCLAEQLILIEQVLGHTPLPVHVGVMSLSAAERVRTAGVLRQEFGTAVAGLMVPVDDPDPDRLAAGLRALLSAYDRPLLVQDYPAWSQISIDVDDLAAAVSRVGGSIAIKAEAPATFLRISRLCQHLPTVPMMSGLGGLGLVDDLAAGATLVATGISRPEVIVQACRAWDEGEEELARHLIDRIGSLIWFETQQVTSIAIRKEHWRRQQVLAEAAVRPPTVGYQPAFDRLSTAHGFPSE